MSSYEQTLRLFERWLIVKEYGEKVTDIKERIITEYIIDLQERGKYTMVADASSRVTNHPEHRRDFRKPISTTTINNYIRNLKAFFSWLEEMEHIGLSPMRKVKELPAERKTREYISNEQIIELMRRFDRSYFSEFRDRTVILLLFDTGMRLGECLCQSIANLDLVKQCVYLDADITKGRKSRTVFFSAKTAKDLRRWLQFKDRYCETDFLFPVKATGQPITIHGFESNFKWYLSRIGASENITPHNIRNNFAKRCLMAGMDIFTLSRILGHSSVSVTEKAYLDVTDDDLMRKYARFSPVDSLF